MDSFEEPLFSFHTLRMSDEEFWSHVKQLDELSDLLVHDTNGLALKIQMNSGKTLSIPFVRFRKSLHAHKQPS